MLLTLPMQYLFLMAKRSANVTTLHVAAELVVFMAPCAVTLIAKAEPPSTLPRGSMIEIGPAKMPLLVPPMLYLFRIARRSANTTQPHVVAKMVV